VTAVAAPPPARTTPAEQRAIVGRARPPWLRRTGTWAINVWAVIGLLYLFLPIFWIVLFSFNDPQGRFNFVWNRFTFDNWRNYDAVPELVDAFWLSVRIGLISTAIATTLGAFVAIALVRYRFRGGALVNLFLVLPLTTPEIVLGSSLLTLFINRGISRGFTTIVVAHVMFSVSFVALTVKARLRGLDWTLEDAAMDLGARPLRVFRKVTLPMITPGILAAALLAFALSIDDFIITLFNAGPEVTFPLYIFGASRVAVPPQINVLATFILVVTLALLGAGILLQNLRERLRT
jgi:spermidine/putrescine transport system permease protein